MSQALVTIVSPIESGKVASAQAAIDGLQNPAAPHIQAALDYVDPATLEGIHFASLHAIRSADGERSYILLEFTADGSDDAALSRFVGVMDGWIRPIFSFATDWKNEADTLEYFRRHRVTVGGGWSDNPGVLFAGTAGMTVGRIRLESTLAAKITDILAAQRGEMHALARVNDVRGHLKNDFSFSGALQPAEANPQNTEESPVSLGISLVLSFVETYLWPLVALVAAWSVMNALKETLTARGMWDVTEAFVHGAIMGFGEALLVAVILVIGGALVLYTLFRRAEERDYTDDRAPDPTVNAAMFQRENKLAQNHMISITQRKPGWIREFTSRVVFWAVAELSARSFKPGFLNNIGTIHFARWVTPPDSPDLIFLSNYDGSWESYLEDFITRAHLGLTAVWSNTIGFPRTTNLVEKGATDGERFKRYARRSMVPTRFWYSAYPTLTTTAIRTNAEIRRGLSGVMTEDEAMHWLALFGSASRPASKLLNNEIQSLIFGGLNFKPFGSCLIFNFNDSIEQSRQWLKGIYPHIAFNDGRRLRADAVVSLGLGARGLSSLGLPAGAIETFPFAFQEGMTSESRARILGDQDESHSTHWRWGRTQPDVVLLIYGSTAESVTALEDAVISRTRACGMLDPYRISLIPVEKDKAEPFGFRDGISQPVIRGTYKGQRNADPIHIVEPGEFILGYPDNRGNRPPGPTLSATADPGNLLPLVDSGDNFDEVVVDSPRDLGFNGSFLVIRELEQNVEAFWQYCRDERQRLAELDRLPPPYPISEKELGTEFIAAKMIGRWRDGSSLVRHPYEPKPVEQERYEKYKLGKFAVGTVEAQDSHTITRPTSHPDHGTPIERSPKTETYADNDFLFGVEDPEALRCPFGAHIRRANPRDSLDPGSAEQISISNRHRIIRVGRQYRPEEGNNPGLLFMCLNGDIERQFEFLQQTWLRSPSFHGLFGEKDPVLGDGETGVCSFTIPSREGPVRLSPMSKFVSTRGGGYFFLPGKRLIEYLGGAS